MLQTHAPQITRHDYEAMREGPPYYQLIQGDLIMSPSPTTPHQRTAGRIFSLIENFLRKHPLGQVFIGPLDVFLTETNVYQPDLFFISDAHLSIITEHGIEGPPDLVIEILSPSTAAYDQGSKRKIYAKTGVQELWIVDVNNERIQIFDLKKDPNSPSETTGPDSVFTSPLLPGLKLRAPAIFKGR